MNSYELLNIYENKKLCNGICKNKTPESAAKKFWRRFKFLNVILIKNISTSEEYIYYSKKWSNKNKRKFSNKIKKISNKNNF